MKPGEGQTAELGLPAEGITLEVVGWKGAG